MKSLKGLMNLKGHTALITGGAGHIGFAMAEALAELSADIILLDINRLECSRKAKYLKNKYKIKTVSFNIDLSNEKEIKTVPKLVQNKFNRLDILINCAALVGTSKLKGWAVPFEKQNIDTWRRALEVNLTSIFILTQSCKSLLLKSKKGSIVNIGSIYGMTGPYMGLYRGTNFGNPAAYAASKGGLLQLTRWLATVLAPDIRVNMITIGGVYRNHKNPFLSRYVERTPLKRMAREEDLKGAVAYLSSDLSNYVTGHNLVVDGGWTTW